MSHSRSLCLPNQTCNTTLYSKHTSMIKDYWSRNNYRKYFQIGKWMTHHPQETSKRIQKISAHIIILKYDQKGLIIISEISMCRYYEWTEIWLTVTCTWHNLIITKKHGPDIFNEEYAHAEYTLLVSTISQYHNHNITYYLSNQAPQVGIDRAPRGTSCSHPSNVHKKPKNLTIGI